MKRLVLILLLLAGPAFAVQPDEMLSDPVLEERAREISKELRCLKCQNQSIDDSNADLARDMRIFVRQRLVAGDSDEQAIQAVVDRFGQFARLRPQFSGLNILLWLGPVILFGIGIFVSFFYLRGRNPDKPEKLSADEEAALKRLMGE